MPTLLRLLLAVLSFTLPIAAAEPAKPVNQTSAGLAIRGFDPVAYFTEGKPLKGSAEFTHSWNGATWRFASAAHRDLFQKNPEAYAPQYGGYCAWAVSQGYTAPIDPKAWKIVEGRLYLNYNSRVQADWEKDTGGFIRKADENWPRLTAQSP